MKCRGCGTSAAPFELADKKGEGKEASGVCLKCLEVNYCYIRSALIHLISSCQSNLFESRDLLSVRDCDVQRAKEIAGL